MPLNLKSFKENKSAWEEKGYKVPKYDIDAMRKITKDCPTWIHFGAGNIFRAFPAVVCQQLLDNGTMETGIIVAEGYDCEIIEKSFKPYDNLTISVTLNSDGTVTKEVVASIAEALTMDFDNTDDTKRLYEIFASPTLQMASFTITEKGYNLKGSDGKYFSSALEDFVNSPPTAKTYIGKLSALIYHRFLSGELPITLVSMDNCSHNGTKLKNAVLDFAENWVENDMVCKEFSEYVKTKVSYPCSMIDKITPRPSDSVLEILAKDGVENCNPGETEKHTFVAPFVNAEAPQYLVIEDNFLNGKLPLDKGGIIYTTKDTVDKSEKMKVCTCLNPLHTTLAIFGCLLDYKKISDEMKDNNLVELIKNIGYKEGLPVVIDPKILSPKKFIDEVIEVRLPNPFMPDTPQRIACDTSQKLSVRFGETIKAYQNSETLKTADLKFIPLVLAGWCRYLLGVNDKGEDMKLSPDPMLEYATNLLKDIKLGCTDKETVHKTLSPLLSDEKIFGVNLYDFELGDIVENYFIKLNHGKGSVEKTISELL